MSESNTSHACMATESINTQSKPLLVLIHGWGADASIWQPVLPGLAEYFSVHSLDLTQLLVSPEQKADVSHLDQSSVVETLSQAIVNLLSRDPSAACHLVGWSLGGMLGIELASQLTGRIQSLTLIAANPCFIQCENWAFAMQPDTYDGFKTALQRSPEKTLRRFALLQTAGSLSAKAELEQLTRMQRDMYSNNKVNQSLLVPTLNLLEHDYRPVLSALDLPVLFCLGEKDALVPAGLADMAEQLTKKACVKLYPEAAHLPFLTYPEQWISDYIQWVGSLDA